MTSWKRDFPVLERFFLSFLGSNVRSSEFSFGIQTGYVFLVFQAFFFFPFPLVGVACCAGLFSKLNFHPKEPIEEERREGKSLPPFSGLDSCAKNSGFPEKGNKKNLHASGFFFIFPSTAFSQIVKMLHYVMRGVVGIKTLMFLRLSLAH